MSETTIYFGPPGTGKTATLLRRVREELDRGVAPERIAYVAFTRRAAREARERAELELGLTPDDLPWWRTLHSTAARELGVGGRLLVGQHWRTLGDALRMDFSDLDEAGRLITIKQDLGHRVQATYYLRRARQRSLAWHDLLSDLGHEFAHHVCRFAKTLTAYKQQHDLFDYADLLDEAPGAVPAQVVLLDEAQDLTAQQWAYFDRLRAGAARVYVAGDDEQAIFGWAGADVERFLSLEGRRVVLDVSHRLPRRVYDVARRVSEMIRVKEPKDWRPGDREGVVQRMTDPTRLDLGHGTWLLLARTRAALAVWDTACRNAAVRYVSAGVDAVQGGEVRAIRLWERGRRGVGLSPDELMEVAALSRGKRPSPESPIWHEALTRVPKERRLYYESVLRRHGKDELGRPARVRVDTIHGAKGAEADHVAVLPDLTPKISRGMRTDPDAEHRVWYVAATRCRESLHVARPDSDLHYPL